MCFSVVFDFVGHYEERHGLGENNSNILLVSGIKLQAK